MRKLCFDENENRTLILQSLLAKVLYKDFQ